LRPDEPGDSSTRALFEFVDIAYCWSKPCGWKSMGANTVESPAERLKVFISYARSDGAALAEDLVTGLELSGFAPFLDRHDIAAAEDWEARLGALIQSADTIVFIISPAAIKSERCAWEVDCAAKFGKRLIPIRLIPIKGDPVAEADVPERLRRLNYVFFREGQSSLKPIAELATALRQDVEWIREHTRLTEIAVRWEARRQAGAAADDLLLRGDDLKEVAAWAARRKENAPERRRCSDPTLPRVKPMRPRSRKQSESGSTNASV
jgi:hypothetical protein